MKLHLFQELIELNQAFDRVLRGLQRMEKVRFFHNDIIRYARAEVESARVDANREFFDNFDPIVESDARWAYQFCHDYDQKTKDPTDFYLELKEREEARRKKGLSPRAMLLPGWDEGDEPPYEERPANKRLANQRRNTKTTARSSRK